MRVGVGFRRSFEQREFRRDRTYLFFDLAEERCFPCFPGFRMSTDEIPYAGIEILRRRSSSEKKSSVANE